MRKSVLVVIVTALILPGWIVGCGQGAFEPTPRADAVAVLAPTSGHSTTGTVIFVRTGQDVRVIAELTGLSPGPHGFHVHTFGDCRASDASSAGRHFNPGKTVHGAPDAATRHAGDLGNIVADETGVAKMDLVLSALDLEGENTIIGRSVVVHAEADDLKPQPAGGSGARLACGVIGIAR